MRCNSCKLYIYPSLKRCNRCGLPTNMDSINNYTQETLTVYNKMETTDINKQLDNIYSQPNERFLNPKRFYKGVKNSEEKTQ